MSSMRDWLTDVASKVPSVSLSNVSLPTSMSNPFSTTPSAATTTAAGGSSAVSSAGTSNENGYAEWERLLRGSNGSNTNSIQMSTLSSSSSSSSSSSPSSVVSSSSASPSTSSNSCYAWLNGILSNLEEQLSLSWQQRMVGFIMFLIAGLIMLGFSFLYLSGVFLGASAKFAMAYGLANIFLLTSSCLFVGPSKQLSTMFNSERWVISLIYLCSLFLTLFCAWQIRSFYVMLPMLAVQFTALLFYVASFVPFGKTMMTRMTTWMAGRLCSSTSSLLPI